MPVEDPSEAIQATIDTELKADNVKSEVRRLAMNDMRFGVHVSLDDFLYMVSRQDRIADYAQNVAEQLAFRPLFDDDEAKANLKVMAKAVSPTNADSALSERGQAWRSHCGCYSAPASGSGRSNPAPFLKETV